MPYIHDHIVVQLDVRLLKPHKSYPVGVSLGCHVDGFVPPKPDFTDQLSNAVGAASRLGFVHPKVNKSTWRRFETFVDDLLSSEHVVKIFPVAPAEATDLEKWLSATDYGEARKDQIRRAYAAESRGEAERLRCKSFVKEEHYNKFKPNRAINSRPDLVKAHAGMMMKIIEKAVFTDNPYFVKKVPADQRVDYVMKMIEHGNTFFATDYSRFESHFVRKWAAIVWKVFRHVLSEHPDRDDYLQWLWNTTVGGNNCYFKNFVIRGVEARMSGDMRTSCANGIMNLLLFLFAWVEAGNDLPDAKATFEGDDGLGACANEALPSPDTYAELGCTLKLDVSHDLEDTSFCSQIFSSVAKDILVDPLDVLGRFGWAGRRYVGTGHVRKLELLRAKSFSYLYQYPRAPIVRALAEYGLRITSHICMDRFWSKSGLVQNYDKAWMKQAFDAVMARGVPDGTVHPASRGIVERKFGVSIEQQLRVERILSDKTDLGPLYLDLEHLFDDDFRGDKSWLLAYENMTGDFDQLPSGLAETSHSNVSNIERNIIVTRGIKRNAEPVIIGKLPHVPSVYVLPGT